MPVRAIAKKTVARNGIGAFILPCNKITIQYCNWGGSSQGIRKLLASGQIDNTAKSKSKIFFNIVQKPGHPKLLFDYNNSRSKEIEIANLSQNEILKKLDEYSQTSGNELFKWNHKVLSDNESVRGIWSPLHAAKSDRFKI